ncbi:TonB-dependent receptor plug domain-containing protein [Corallincola platygyrae]|uniref:TonB-dependent receptor plug domain-containing protein n=1 Tax=Corallincola platygyrae TaxID=1193278 RepID=A0ABW4XPF8_9GAMM
MKKRLLSASAGLLLSPIALAVEQAVEDPNAEVERIQVTGSHLKGVDMEGALPVITISEEDIRTSGANTVIELINQLPQFGGGAGTFSTALSGAKQGDAPAGAAGISLRGLGTSSTLTLLNGRRMSVSSFANGNESFVDVNAIPLAAIERVEILTSGASAIYGADAVAGVVNFILRKDFEGFEISASYGDSDASSDDTKKNLNLAFGHVEDNWQMMATFDYFDRNALYDRDRSATAVEPRPSQQGIFPSFNDLWAMDTPEIGDFVEAACPEDQFGVGGFGEYCELNRNAYTATLPEMESYSSLITLDYTFDNGMVWFNEFVYSNKESSSNSEPAPFSGDDAPISYDHPNMPQELRDRFDEAGVDPAYPIFAWGRFPDARTVEVESDNYRVATGLRGELMDWEWQTSFLWGKNENTQKATAGIYHVEKFKAAVGGELCADGSIGCDPDVDGLWYNVFGGQTDNDPMVVDLLREEVPRDGESELMVLDFQASGEIYELPAGSVVMAFGAEYRTEEVEDNPSPLATAIAGDVPVFGFGSTEAEADRWAYAVFTEFAVPVTETLDLQLAARFDEYESFGSDVSPKVGFRYQPTDSLVLRGAWAQSFRAPSLAQVGAGITLSSGALPCSGEFQDNFCGGFDEDDGYLSEIYGNDDLEAETADSYDLGVIWSPTQELTFKVDYWKYKHEDLVGTDDEDLFRQALRGEVRVVSEFPDDPEDPDQVLADGEVGIITRDGTIGSPIEEIRLELVNFGFQETDGFDISAEYDLNTSEWGDFGFYLDATYLNSFEQKLSSGSDTEELAGGWRYPRWLANATMRWRFNDFLGSLRAEYTHSYDDDHDKSAVPEGRQVPSWTTFDLYLSYDITGNSYVSFNVDNLFDREPPVAYGSGANVDLVNHDSMGRYYTLGYTLKF